MTQDDHSQDRLYELRIQAETALPKKGFDVPDLSDLSTEEIHKLVHELHVHQIELEMQNEDLGQAHKKLEELKDKYVDLYDFAPGGSGFPGCDTDERRSNREFADISRQNKKCGFERR
ncbi:MAG: hypothetical protein WCP72_11445 [Desulfomonile sp.]